MPRRARVRSKTDVYHVMCRGVSRMIIFEDEEDCSRYLALLSEYKNLYHVKFYAWCLMGNHVHLLLQVNFDSLSKFIKMVNQKYVAYYKKKYEYVGHLFQDRFVSEPIETESYFLSAMKYIHQNPVKAGIGSVEDYPWSSYREYIGSSFLVQKDYVLELYGGLDNFVNAHNYLETKVCLDVDDFELPTPDYALVDTIRSIYGECWLREIKYCSRETRDSRIDVLLEKGFSVRQIERITGVSRGVICRAKDRTAAAGKVGQGYRLQ